MITNLQNENNMENQTKEWNGKVALVVSYQWQVGDEVTNLDEAIILNKDFDNIDTALDALIEAMPMDFDLDDGEYPAQWADMGIDEAFSQYAVYLDERHTVLAVMRPLFE